MQPTCGPFVLKTIIIPFKRLFVLRHSFIRSLYFIQIFIFIPLTHSAPFLHFSHILFYTNFFLMYITTRNIFLIPDDAVARNLIIIFNFSSQRPHLIKLYFSVLLQWNFPRNISANLLIFTNKASSHVVIV